MSDLGFRMDGKGQYPGLSFADLKTETHRKQLFDLLEWVVVEMGSATSGIGP
jgi:hypothetical protein